MTADRLRDPARLGLLTIVIVTRNRPTHLERVVSFWRELPVKVLVLDGSDSPVSFVDSANFTYVYSQSSYLQRLSLAAQLVSTDFVALCSDDELFLPSALSTCVRFLEEHGDFVAATGEAVGLFQSGKEYNFGLQYVERRNFTLAKTDPWIRAEEHMSDYRVCAYYAVVRTAQWALIWQSIAQEEFSPYAIQELQFEAAVAFSGKMAVLPTLMWIRNNTVKPIRSEGMPGFDDRATFESWWLSAALLSERRRFLEANQKLFERIIRSFWPAEPSVVELQRVESIYFSYYSWLRSRLAPTRQSASILGRVRRVLKRLAQRRLSLPPGEDEISVLLSPRAESNRNELERAVSFLVSA